MIFQKFCQIKSEDSKLKEYSTNFDNFSFLSFWEINFFQLIRSFLTFGSSLFTPYSETHCSYLNVYELVKFQDSLDNFFLKEVVGVVVVK